MTKKPNVIYVLVDDMGYGDFSAFNDDGPNTPALERMICQGVTLNNCYSASPVCAPARAAILTGRYPQRTGVIDTLEVRGYDRLKPSETTLADVFKANGYKTALIGKWHLGAIDPIYHPNNRGFDYFFGFRGGWNDYYDYNIERNGERLSEKGEYLTDRFSREAVAYVNEHAAEPFFLHLTYNAPHFPLQAPDEVVQKYIRPDRTTAVAKLFAMIEIMDRGFGELLDALDDAGIADDTIVVFASDNGPDFGGEGDNCLKRFNCDLRGEKMMAFEGGIKVPAVVRWTGKLPGNTLCDAVIHGTDWLPTLLSMCEIKLPDVQIDGRNVYAQLSGEQDASRTLYWQWNRYKPEIKTNAAMRQGDMKLVHAPDWAYLDLPSWETDMDVEMKYHPERYTEVTDREVPELPFIKTPDAMLFDLGVDPGEKNDLKDAMPKQTADMEAALNAWFDEVESERLS